MMRRKIGSTCFAALAVIGVMGTQAEAQLHGVRIAKGCVSPVCVGDTTDCIVEFGYNDGHGDTLEILEAFDIMDREGDQVRIPAVGDLPITLAEGNTTCTVGGSLPCRIGPAFSTLSGLPGSDEDGIIQFRQNTYVVLPDDPKDPDLLKDQATVIWEDLCDHPDTQGCGADIPNDAPAPASTRVPDCDDGDPCTIDSCEGGVCSNVPIECDDDDACTSDACVEGICVFTNDVDCDDGDACTDDRCVPETGECENTPNYDCDDGNACTEDSCDSATGECVHSDPPTCDDGDACTDDRCVPETGECENTPNYDCDDGDACTEDSCDSATGECVHSDPPDCGDGDACTGDRCDPATGECLHSDPPDCDDGDACTDDSCDPATGECVNEPNYDCDDGDACTEDSCDSATGECVHSEPRDCDDGNECTEDRCVPKTGECENVEIVPPPPGCDDFAGCTPGFWKQTQHYQYWVGYAPSDSFETTFGVDAIILDGKSLRDAMWTGGGGEAALGRHAVAALLNSSNGEVAYGFSTAAVIAMVQEAYATGDFQGAKGLLAEQNELGCTVDTSNKNPGRGGRSLRGR